MRIKSVHVAWIAVGVLGVGGLAVARAFPQASAATASSIYRDQWWPPRPGQIVSIDTWDLPPQSGLSQLPGSGRLPIYTVPAGKWLVVTDVDARGTGSGSAILAADLNGTTTSLLGGLPIGFHSAVGLTFPPGSEVVWVNGNAYDQSMYFHLTGYLTSP